MAGEPGGASPRPAFDLGLHFANGVRGFDIEGHGAIRATQVVKTEGSESPER